MGKRGKGFKGLFSKDFISVFNILSIFAMCFLVYPFHLFQFAIIEEIGTTSKLKRNIFSIVIRELGINVSGTRNVSHLKWNKMRIDCQK